MFELLTLPDRGLDALRLTHGGRNAAHLWPTADGLVRMSAGELPCGQAADAADYLGAGRHSKMRLRVARGLLNPISWGISRISPSAFTGRARCVAGAILVAMLGPAVLAGAAPASAQDRHAALIIDVNNGQVMHSEKADELRFPASLTKIMTLYLAFEAIQQGRASYATRIRVSREAASAPPTKLDLDPGDTIALGDAMKALVTKSANDAAVAIAEHLGGTEARFARMMTDKARLFGMSRTTFHNASGLPDPGQVTTARDMVRLALRVQDDFPQHYHLFSLRSFSYGGSTYRNHNNLLFRFQGTDGFKTGYTRASGFNLVASVRRGGRHVIGVVFGGRTAARRDDAMQLLLSRALVQASPYKTRRSAPVLVAAAAPAQRPWTHVQPPPQAAPMPVIAERPRPQLRAQPQPWSATRVAEAGPGVPARSAAGGFQATVPAPVPAMRPQTVRAQVTSEESSLRPGMGAAPSTFQQQAANLSRGGHAVMPVAQRTASASTSAGMPGSAAGGYEIQIGAYGSAVEADRALAAARNSAGELLSGASARAMPFSRDARMIYRARFAGFDSASAASTCSALRRRQIDCFVTRGE